MLTDDIIVKEPLISSSKIGYKLITSEKYIMMRIDGLTSDITPIKKDYSHVKGGLYMAVILGGLLLSGASFVFQEKYTKITNDIYVLQQHIE